MDNEKILTNAMLKALVSQRDAFANDSVNLTARVALLSEQLKEAQTELDALKAKKKKKAPKEETPA